MLYYSRCVKKCLARLVDTILESGSHASFSERKARATLREQSGIPTESLLYRPWRWYVAGLYILAVGMRDLLRGAVKWPSSDTKFLLEIRPTEMMVNRDGMNVRDRHHALGSASQFTA